MELALSNSSRSLYPVKSGDVKAKMEIALSSIEGMNESFKTFTRSHSDLMWNAMILDEESDTRNIRQISAEIKKKRDALSEVYFAYNKDLNRAKFYKKKMESAESEVDREYYDILATEKQSYAARKHEAILGATKDIEALKATYDKIMENIIANHGKFDESIFELEERRYWVKRGFKQSMQDVRERGSISKGEQMLLEQIGLEPMQVQQDIRTYLDFIRTSINEGNDISQKARQDFFEQMADKYVHKVDEKLALRAETKDHLYITEKSDDS